jgi:FAD/FMN-containing dehydrogenase
MLEMAIFTVNPNATILCALLMCIAIMLYNDKQRKQAEEVVHRMVKRAVEMEGTVTGEHGVGLVKRDYLNHELGETTVDAMRKVTFQLSKN